MSASELAEPQAAVAGLRGGGPAVASPAVRLFPLPVSAIERYFLDLETPARPMSMAADLAFDGPFDRGLFANAFERAVDRHPLLTATIDRSGPRPAWLRSEVRPRLEIASRQGPPTELPRFDLTSEPGFRAVVSQSAGMTYLSVQAHHAVCDGQGLRQLVFELLLAYDREVAASQGRPAAAMPRVEPQRLARRGVLAPAIKTEPLGMPEKWNNLVAFFTKRPAPLRRADGARRTAGGDGTFVLQRTLDAETTAAFKRRREAADLSPNDALVTLLFQTIAEWNAERGASAAETLRILIPVDLRKVADALLPAANKMGICFLTRPAAVCGDFGILADSVRGEMNYIKDRGVGAEFVRTLQAAERCWWLMQRISRGGRFAPTAVFSDVGDPTRRYRKFAGQAEGAPVFGDLRLRTFHGTSPLPPGVGMSVCLVRLPERYHFAFVPSRRLFDEETAARFADRYLKRLSDWSAEA